MSTNIIQPSFASGELSPSLFARVDLAKYKVGAAAMRNFFVDYRGGASSRPGTLYCATSATPITLDAPRVVRFQVSPQLAYVVEFGTDASNSPYIAFYQNGAQVLSGGSPYTLSSPYAITDVPLLKFEQANDVLTITHPSYPIHTLNYFSATSWTLTAVTIGPTQLPPTIGTATAIHGTESAASGDATTTVYTYAVTAVSASTGEESIPSSSVNSSNSRIMSSDGNAFVALTWSAPSGPAPGSYNIYRGPEVPNTSAPSGSILGLIGSTTGLSYADRDGQPDFSTAPPLGNNPFASVYPGCATYYGQRLWYAYTTSSPETFWGSKVGAFNNFDFSNPTKADDSVTDTLASTQLNSIKSMLSMPSGLVMFTSGGVWQISGGGTAAGGLPTAITPSDITAQPQSNRGASDLPPIQIDYEIMFGQAKQSVILVISYNFYVNIYTANDTTTLSNHLFANRTIAQWAYAEEPYKIIWMVRDDGVLLSFSYLKEQEVAAYARHDTNGKFASVCTVSENGVDAAYFVVSRVINGTGVYMIERMQNRIVIDANEALGIPANIENAWCLDCALSLSQPTPSGALYPNFGANVVGGSVTFGSSAGVFVPSNVGSVIRGNGGRAVITSYTSSSTVTATILSPFPPQPNDPTQRPIPIMTGFWSMTAPVTVITGLSYLNGMTVGILADGNVMPQQVVSGGQITLPVAASNVVVGLPYQCQLQTLYLDAGEPTVQGKRKKINAVTVRVKDTRGLKAGRTLNTLVQIKEWNSTVALGGPLPLITGDERIVLDPVYDTGGQMWFQLDDPVPATILGVIPEVSIGDS
jgi:hypothetical protein